MQSPSHGPRRSQSPGYALLAVSLYSIVQASVGFQLYGLQTPQANAVGLQSLCRPGRHQSLLGSALPRSSHRQIPPRLSPSMALKEEGIYI
jgi:hypothetical protein